MVAKKQVRKFADLKITTHAPRNPVEGLIGGRVTIKKGSKVVAGGRKPKAKRRGGMTREEAIISRAQPPPRALGPGFARGRVYDPNVHTFSKPKGWVKEPVRHGLAAKGVKTTMHDIRSGKARRMRGLDTSAGSRYAKLREMGYSDEDAQANIYGIGREEGKPGIGVPLSRKDEEYIEAGIAQQEREFERGVEAALMIGAGEEREMTRKGKVIRSLGLLSQKAQESPMNHMTGPRITEAAHLVSLDRYSEAIGMLNEVAGLGPKEVTRRAKHAIGDIKIMIGLEGE